jgi:bacterioferritin-associated ferredoxin
MFVCLCRAVSDSAIRAAIRAGANTVDAVGAACAAGTKCGKCRIMIETMIRHEHEVLIGPAGPGERGVTR